MDAVYDAIIGAVNIRQVRSASYRPNSKALALRLSGGLDPSNLVLLEAEPRVTLESMDLAGVLAGISVSAGLSVASGTLTVPWNRRAAGGTFAGGSNNFSLTGANGMAVINSISGSQGDEGAVADIELCFLSADGLAAPVTANVNQALASQAYVGSYAMGPFYINSSQVTQVKSVKVNTGLALVLKKYDGSNYPTIAFIQQRDPTMDVTFENADALATHGPLFASITTAAAYFRVRVDRATYTADASAAHVKLSFATGLTTVEDLSGRDTANADITIRLHGKALSSSVASAIP